MHSTLWNIRSSLSRILAFTSGRRVLNHNSDLSVSLVGVFLVFLFHLHMVARVILSFILVNCLVTASHVVLETKVDNRELFFRSYRNYVLALLKLILVIDNIVELNIKTLCSHFSLLQCFLNWESRVVKHMKRNILFFLFLGCGQLESTSILVHIFFSMAMLQLSRLNVVKVWALLCVIKVNVFVNYWFFVSSSTLWWLSCANFSLILIFTVSPPWWVDVRVQWAASR
jgi:hypothetical protein